MAGSQVQPNPILAASAPQVKEERENPSRLEAIQQAVTETGARIGDIVSSLEQGAADADLAASKMLADFSIGASAQQTIAAVEDIADMESQNATRVAALATGGREVQAARAARLTEDAKRLEDALNVREQTLTDDNLVVTAIKNALNIEFFGDKRGKQGAIIDNAANQYNQTLNEIQGATVATESVAAFNTLTEINENNATIVANQKLIAAEAGIKASQQEIANIHASATQMTAIANMDGAGINNLIKAQTAQNAEENQELARIRSDRQNEVLKLEREKLDLELPKQRLLLEKAEIDLERAKTLGPQQTATALAQAQLTQQNIDSLLVSQDTQVSYIQEAQSAAGIPIEEKDDILYGMSPQNKGTPIGDKYNALYLMGGTANKALGNSPAAAIRTLAIVAPDGNTAETKGTRLLDTAKVAQATIYSNPSTPAPRDDATLDSNFNTAVATILLPYKQEIKTGDDSNPYRAPPFSELAKSKAIQDTVLFKNVLGTRGMQEFNPQTIMDATLAGIQNGSVSIEQASAGIVIIASTAAALNNTSYGGFERVGIPNQDTYNVRLNKPSASFQELSLGVTAIGLSLLPALPGAGTGVPATMIAGSFLASSVPVNLMDETKVQHYLIQARSSTPAAEPEANTNIQ